MNGQENLLKKLTTDCNNLPHSILLVGERGSGQLEICERVSDYYGLNLFDLTKIDEFKEFIDKIEVSTNKTLYVVDMLNLDDYKGLKQNSLLKLFEEPNSYTYIIILCEDISQVLPTLVNRSIIYNLEKYSKEDLLKYSNNELVLKICNTPGQIEVANNTDLNSLFSLCNTIIDKIDKASFPNTLSISNKVNFDDEYDKYDLFLFIRVLSYLLIERSLSDNRFMELYKEINKMNKIIWVLQNKKQFFDNFLVNLWISSRSLQERL